jgi:hypothetical protein
MDFVQGEGTILKNTINHASDHAPAGYRGFGSKLKATSTWFVADEAIFVKKKSIARGVFIGWCPVRECGGSARA